MTKHEFLTAIANNDTLSDDLRAYANEEMSRMAVKTARNSARTHAKREEENAPLRSAIMEQITGHDWNTCSSIASLVGISTPKANAILAELVKMGLMEVEDRKIPKVGSRKVYKVK